MNFELTRGWAEIFIRKEKDGKFDFRAYIVFLRNYRDDQYEAFIGSIVARDKCHMILDNIECASYKNHFYRNLLHGKFNPL